MKRVDIGGLLTRMLKRFSGTESTTLSIGNYTCGGILTSSAGQLFFSIPTGRVFPDGTTISRITFDMVARASNANGGGYYIIKSTSAGTTATGFDSSTSSTFYNANNVAKSLTASMWTKYISGNTNVYISFNSGTEDFFSGTSTIRGYINNNAVSILLTNIYVYLTFPSN